MDTLNVTKKFEMTLVLGVICYMCWGGVVINVDRLQTTNVYPMLPGYDKLICNICVVSGYFY